MIELKEFVDKALELFEVQQADQLGQALIKACDDTEKLEAFCKLTNNDLTYDWLQKIYQYYLADRKEKKQDYTPQSLAQLMGALTGESKKIIDICAGSGALIIQKWVQNPDINAVALEIDENVIPFLLFNMVVRNISCDVMQIDALTGEKPLNMWKIVKGDKFGHISNIKSAV